jgi:hypothetical protein
MLTLEYLKFSACFGKFIFAIFIITKFIQMAKKNSSPKKAMEEKSTMIEIAEKVGELAGNRKIHES